MNKTALISLLENRGMRVTRPRLVVAELLFGDGRDRHVSAEAMARQIGEADHSISLATVYNTLNSFVELGLLRQIQTGGARIVYDTNVTPHHHFLREATGELIDIPADDIRVKNLPDPPEGERVKGWDLIIRI